MAWTTPTDKVTGDVITAAQWNSFLGLTGDMSLTATGIVTTQGDMVYATAANTLARLAKGTAYQELAMNAGATAPSWQASPTSVLTTTGDLLYASGSNTLARLAGTTAGYILTAGGASTAPAYAANVSSVGAVLDGGGAAIAADTIIYVRVPFACTINEFTILADQSGSITVKVYKDTYANYPPTSADDISNGGLAVTTATNATDTTLTGWTASIAAGDVLAFTNTDLATTITRVTCQLKVTKS
ncbi:MAG: hypothetical protein O3A25_19590 [Acidobacteria bacterium]|nr:hypothetical protein [Acidobacteriota bacterium]